VQITKTQPAVADSETHTTVCDDAPDEKILAAHNPTVAVSVIIPAFNAAATIRRALSSLQAQTIGAWQAIVVDDASTDDLPSVVNGMAKDDGRIIYVRNPDNRGPAESRNRGIGLASGAWIAFLDADDAFATERLSQLLAIATETDADVVSDNLLIVDQPNASNRLLFDPDECPTPRSMSLLEFVQGCSFDPRKPPRSSYTLMQPIVKRSFLADRRVAFPSDSRNGEDLIFNLNLLASGARWVVTSVPMYTYFVTRGSQAEIIRDRDRQAMWASVRALLDKPEARRDPRLAKCLRDYLRVSYYLHWSGLIKQCIKRRSARMLVKGVVEDHGSLWLFALEALQRSPRLCVREIARHWHAVSGETGPDGLAGPGPAVASHAAARASRAAEAISAKVPRR
jgi:succinoglycan biosynthesis protein ExoO